MGLLLHMRDKVFRVKDQGVLPVPLDPDLLFLAENAHQSNIMQQIYRTQMERNRSRGPFTDEFKEEEHPRAEGGEFTSGSGGGKKEESPKDDWHHRTNRATRHKHAEHESAAEASREKWDAMSPVEKKKWFTDHPRKARVLARKNRPPYDTPHRLMEKSNGKFVIHREDEDYGGSSNPYFFYNWRQIGDEYANRETAERHFKQRTDLDEYRKEEAEKKAAGEAKESERRAKWEAGRPQREAAEAKKQGERAKKESAMPADLQQLKSVIEKLPDEGKKGFAKSLIDRFVEKGSLTAGQQPWVKKLIDMAEHGIDKDPVIKKQADELHGIKHKLTGRDLEAAESMMEQFNARGTLSERQQSYFESLLKKARKATGDAAEFKEHEHPRKKDGKFTAKGSAEGGATSPSGTTAKAEWAEEPKESPEVAPTVWNSDFAKWGFEFDRSDHDGSKEQRFFKNDKTGATLRVSIEPGNDDVGYWQYTSRKGEESHSYGRRSLKQHLESQEELSKVKGPKPPQKLINSVMQAASLKYDSYDEQMNRWVFKSAWGNGEKLEYNVEKLPGMGGAFWEHTKPGGIRYMGYGDANLRRHLERSDRGEIYEGKLSRYWGEKLKSTGFEMFVESDTSAAYKDVNGDQIYVYKDTDKPETAKWRVISEQRDPGAGYDPVMSEKKRFTRDGKGLDELHKAIDELKTVREEQKRNKAHMEAMLTEEYTTIAADMMKSLGYPPARLKISHTPYSFTLDGRQRFAAGTADLQTGIITLYPSHLVQSAIRGVVAHEVMHQKFQNMLNEYDAERAEIQADRREDTPNERHFIMHNAGDLKEQYIGDYPIYAAIQPIVGGQADELAATDGVTQYSTDWWNEYKSGKAQRDQALHETLAEMAYLETTDPAKLKEVAKPWRDLYAVVTNMYRDKERRANWKLEHQEERWRWQRKDGPDKIAASPAPTAASAPAGEVSSPAPAGGSIPHPAVTQLAHALAQVFSLGDRAFKKEDHPQAPEGAPEGKGGQFVSKGEAGGGGSTEGAKPAAKPAERAERARLPSIKAPVTNTLLPGSAPKSHTATISSRLLTGVGATDDEYRRADLDAAKENAESFDHNTALFDNPEVYPNFKDGELDVPPDQRVRAIINHMKENLRYLYDKAPKQIREQGHEWYEGAHDLAEADAKKYGLPLQSVVGVYAALSPQNLWDMNVHQAKVVLDVYHNQQDHGWDEDMERTAKRIWKPKDQALLNTIKVPFGQLTNPAAKAMWIRTYDEAHNTDRSFNALSPDGRVVGTYKNLDGVTNKPAAWHALTPITNAILSLESGGDRTILSPAMGKQHKVRSFYNNILDPNSDNNDVTVDTHAVGAALMRPLGGTTIPVMHSFGKGPSTKAESEAINYHGTSAKGISTKGLYPIYAEAYRELAKELKIKPRVLQSITWEAKRRLFDERMTDKAKDAVELAWHDYRTGKKSHKETWDAIVKIAGGFSKGQEGASDNTSGRPTGGANEGGGRTGDARELYRSSVRGQASRTVDVRGGGHAARGVAAGARLLWKNARLTVLLR